MRDQDRVGVRFPASLHFSCANRRGFEKEKKKRKRQIGLLAVSLRIINKRKIVYVIHKHPELYAFYFNLLGHEVVPARLISHWGIQHSCRS